MIYRTLLLLLVLASPLYAGLWDVDRPDQLPSTYDVIGGRFDDFPPSYYEHRLQRALSHIEALADLQGDLSQSQTDQVADALPHFDDATVAHLRLNQFAEAIIVADRKNQLMALIEKERTATVREHRFRATANKAACLHQRWQTSGDTVDGDLAQAKELLNALYTEDPYNSDTRWSLKEVDWLTSKPTYTPGSDPIFPNMLGLTDASFRGSHDESAVIRTGLGGSIPWLSRRIVYEHGWQDVDVMYALSLVLYLSGRTEESLFAWFRVSELIENGHRSRVSNAPGPKTLTRMMGVHLEDVKDQAAANKLYRELRRLSDTWRASRRNYVENQLTKGSHPDTHTDFWVGWTLDDEITDPGDTGNESVRVSPILLLGGFGGLLLVLILIIGATVFMSRKGPAPSVDEL